MSHSMEEPLVADEGINETMIDDNGIRYTINSVGQQEFIDEEGNRYVYQEFTGPMNTQLRAAQRDMMKKEKEEKVKVHSKADEKHKAKLLEIANKGNQRQFPYGTNYSQKKDDAQMVNKIKYKKVTKEVNITKILWNKFDS